MGASLIAVHSCELAFGGVGRRVGVRAERNIKRPSPRGKCDEPIFLRLELGCWSDVAGGG